MIESTTLAYLAGVVDSDGYITINRSIRKGRRYYYAPVIGITGTVDAPHQLAAELFGGKVRTHIPPIPTYRPQHQWQRMGGSAVGPILAVLPYLRVKQAQAYLALDLYELREGTGDPDDRWPWAPAGWDPTPTLDAFYGDVRSLNHWRRDAAGRELDGRTWDEYPESTVEAQW